MVGTTILDHFSGFLLLEVLGGDGKRRRGLEHIARHRDSHPQRRVLITDGWLLRLLVARLGGSPSLLLECLRCWRHGGPCLDHFRMAFALLIEQMPAFAMAFLGGTWTDHGIGDFSG